MNIGSAQKMDDSFSVSYIEMNVSWTAEYPCKWLEHALNSNVHSMQGARSVYRGECISFDLL